MNNCGISRWDDPNEINARLKALTSQPIWEVTDEYYNNVILNYFDEKCKASKAVYEESKEYIPGGVQHNLAFNKPFPMCMARADGAYLYDRTEISISTFYRPAARQFSAATIPSSGKRSSSC